jgi:hypothetical protein
MRIPSSTVKMTDNLDTLMKDCNSYLTNALCQALDTLDMTAYHYLTNLDFVKDASDWKTNFGRIPQAESLPDTCSSSQNRQRNFSRSDTFSVPQVTIAALSLCLLTSTLASYTTPNKLILGRCKGFGRQISSCDLELLVYEMLSYEFIRPYATSV